MAELSKINNSLNDSLKEINLKEFNETFLDEKDLINLINLFKVNENIVLPIDTDTFKQILEIIYKNIFDKSSGLYIFFDNQRNIFKNNNLNFNIKNASFNSNVSEEVTEVNAGLSFINNVKLNDISVHLDDKKNINNTNPTSNENSFLINDRDNNSNLNIPLNNRYESTDNDEYNKDDNGDMDMSNLLQKIKI